MSVGALSVTLVVTPADKALRAMSAPWFRQLVTFTVSGATNAAEQLILLAYRGSTIVGICQGMTGSSTNASGTMDLNTTELLAVMTGVRDGDIRTLDLRLWNFSTLESVARGTMDVRGSGTYADVSTVPTSPIASTTLFWGKLALYNGLTYIKNDTDNLYYPFSLQGAGDQVHEHIDEAGGITIPGG